MVGRNDAMLSYGVGLVLEGWAAGDDWKSVSKRFQYNTTCGIASDNP